MRVLPLNQEAFSETAEVLAGGGIVCFPTDTIYGLLAVALNRKAVERLYSFRRPSGRPFLLLIPDTCWLDYLKLRHGRIHLRLMKEFNATFLFYKKNSIPLYLTRGRKSLAVRLPRPNSYVSGLFSLIDQALVAPSANPEGMRPAVRVEEAMDYFGDKVDLYVDGGKIEGKPSTIVRFLHPGGLRCVREGNIPFMQILEAYRRLKTISSSLPEDAP
ncbi:MAG: L-threonylcarbamoyladenylate synthase [Aquificaceae bacterium]|jgi:L-threonylcarbamoyladenylate synthase|uniref:L-threonylcarbamoyladenylate synthase n=1 Tax=Hydrogenobacter sp. Uz 6-8 TaxID=3384828 RepID=UPI00309F0DC8